VDHYVCLKPMVIWEAIWVQVAGRTLRVVSIAEQPDEPRVGVYPPDEALRRAQQLPPRERLVIDDVPQDEWTAFQEALAEA